MLRLKLLLVVTLSFFSAVSPSDRNIPNIATVKNIVTGVTGFSNRIMGGEPADIEEYPYQVSFSMWILHLCGGFIISEDYVLTAAHCVMNLDTSKVVLRVGSSWRKNGTIIHLAEVIPHPEYNPPRRDKDVAVIKTAEPIQFTDDIQPVKLPEKNRPLLDNSLVKVSGWGKTAYESVLNSGRLMDVEIPVVPHAKCLEAYPDDLTENMWCGGDYELGGVGPCEGDSGGAAVQDGIAVGIVSFSRGCGQKFSPAVFADIAAPAIRDFITEHTGL